MLDLTLYVIDAGFNTISVISIGIIPSVNATVLYGAKCCGNSPKCVLVLRSPNLVHTRTPPQLHVVEPQLLLVVVSQFHLILYPFSMSCLLLIH